MVAIAVLLLHILSLLRRVHTILDTRYSCSVWWGKFFFSWIMNRWKQQTYLEWNGSMAPVLMKQMGQVTILILRQIATASTVNHQTNHKKCAQRIPYRLHLSSNTIMVDVNFFLLFVTSFCLIGVWLSSGWLLCAHETGIFWLVFFCANGFIFFLFWSSLLRLRFIH